MAGELNGKKVAFLVADGFEKAEMTEPRQALQDAGAQTALVSPAQGQVRSFDHDDPSDSFLVDLPLDRADPGAFDALVLPGGVANPDKLRMNPKAVQFVRAFFEAEKPVGVICHGPWTLIDAGVVRGVTITSWPSLRTDLRNAGANWVDQEVVVDKGLVSSRKPGDLPAFCAKIVEEFREGKHAGQREKAMAAAP